MDKTTKLSDLEGTREKCIYTLKTFVNQDGFKIEEHTPLNPKDGVAQFYGFYLVNTEVGPIDRYFKFEDGDTVEDCFDNFRVLAEKDAENLAAAMREESKRLDNEADAESQADAEFRAPPQSDAVPSEDTQVFDENDCPIT